MAEDKKEPWLNYLALTTIIFAVAATLSTFKGGGHSTRSVLSQEKASNKWAYYQSKSLKAYIFETQKDLLELESQRISPSEKKNIEAYTAKVTEYEDAIKRYEKEKSEIKVEAEGFESQRDEAQKHSQAFGMAVIFLQISILLSSIAALIKRKYLWYMAMGVGTVGLFYFLNGFLLFL
jgi:transposase